MELKQYFRILQKRLWLIVLIVVVAMVAAGIKSFYFTTPIYAANAKLIVNQSSGDRSVSLNASTIQTSIYLINSYKEIIRSSAVMNKVVEQYPELGISPSQIASKISVTSSNNSQVMDLVYEDISYAKAANVVNAVSAVFKEEIPNIMNVDNITILSGADTTISPAAVNFNPVMNMLISFVISLLLGIGFIFLLDYLDDTLKTEKEIKEIMNLPVLAVVGKIKRKDLKKLTRSQAIQKQKAGESQYATIQQ